MMCQFEGSKKQKDRGVLRKTLVKDKGTEQKLAELQTAQEAWHLRKEKEKGVEQEEPQATAQC